MHNSRLNFQFSFLHTKQTFKLFKLKSCNSTAVELMAKNLLEILHIFMKIVRIMINFSEHLRLSFRFLKILNVKSRIFDAA